MSNRWILLTCRPPFIDRIEVRVMPSPPELVEHEDRWVVRLPDAGQAELSALGGSQFEPMPGRPTRNFLALPASIVGDDAALPGWLERALAHARSLPPK